MSIEEVRALVAERQRYDDWLAALDAKRADTPPRVFERVYADYVGRRTSVIAGLQSHVTELATLGNDLEQRLADLETRLAAHEEELAEGMLRNLVGEFDDQRWQAVRGEVEAKIDLLGTERSALLAEVEDVRSLLTSAQVTPSVPPSAPPPENAGAPLAEAPAAAAPSPERLPEPSPELSPAEEVSAIFADAAPDGHDFETVVLTPMSAAPTEIVEEPALLDIDVSGIVDAPEHDAGQVTSSEVDDALAMFGEVTGPADQQFVQSLQGIEADHASPPEGATASAPSPQAPIADDPFDDLAFLRSVIEPGDGTDAPASAAGAQSAAGTAGRPAEPQKTLRCTECGTMNLPTEWYCERCGGELAAF